MVTLFSFSLSWNEILIFFFAATLIGMAKTGVHGAGMMAVPLLAAVFGGQISSGILLPVICLADAMAVWYYHRHASWHHLRKLFPWAALGTVLGTLVGGMIDDGIFKIIMAVVIIGSVITMLWLNRGHQKDIPDFAWFAILIGIVAGFVSMVGNLAGPLMAVYFLSMRLPKDEYIGTTAWFFMVMNWFKVPFHVWGWHTINLDTFLLDLTTLPFIAFGAYAGIVIVKHLKEHVYRWFIIIMTLVAAVFMLI
ncbi:sulfite exporter TauE/SafE family protein [Fulvivirgaceae bacterium PWU4]|uniref:Probable membrane transporter protein n=1 Tax=Chryseosolibacter histidini TaxID=2782349 RepID=A0AAP2GK31_9BACT|nr:sulfite exporter TauE/SafE family protein [Chryseosolibacter histidini]MBT1698619.1 sulfite exporter TauE/SafE family protein [Chryseosolibacter histidini]